VYFTARDARELGYHVYVILDATRGIAEETINLAISDMQAHGVHIIQSADLPESLISDAANTRTKVTVSKLLL